jgi:hypothetical protein
LGDNRPFVMVAMPDGTTEGIVLITLTEFTEIISLIP